MHEPERWSDSEGELARLLRAGRSPRALPEAVRLRSARRVASLSGVPAAAGTMFWIKNVAFAALLGAAGGGVVAGVLPALLEPHDVAQQAPAPRPSALTPPLITASPAPPVPPAPASALAASASPAQVRPAVSAFEESAAERLRREARLLEAARARLATDPGTALSLLDQHQREFHNGALSMERELLSVDALKRSGRAAEAEVRAASLLRRHPGSLYEQRLERILGKRSVESNP